MGKQKRKQGTRWYRQKKNKFPWDCSDYNEVYIEQMKTRLVNKDLVGDHPKADRLRNELPGYGEINEVFPIYYEPIFRLADFEKVTKLVLDTFQIPYDEANMNDKLSTRGRLELLDIVNMPAMNALQLSCAERLQDGFIVECYIDPETGKAEFVYIDWEGLGASVRSPGILDVRYRLPADQYNPKYDLVVVTGFDPPSYRWFYDDWHNIIAGGNQTICPKDFLGSCFGESLEGCGNTNQFLDQAFVPYQPIKLIGNILDKFEDEVLVSIAPSDSFIGFLWSINFEDSLYGEHSVGHVNSTPQFLDLGQSAINHTDPIIYEEQKSSFNSCGTLVDPLFRASSITRDTYVDFIANQFPHNNLFNKINLGFPSAPPGEPPGGFYSYDFEGETWVGDIESVQFLWIGQRISSIDLLEDEFGVGRKHFTAEKNVGVYPIPSISYVINETKTNVRYSIDGVWPTREINEQFGPCGDVGGSPQYIYIDNDGNRKIEGDHYPWALCGAEGTWGGFVCHYWAIINRAKPSFIVQGPNACEVADTLSVKVLPIIQTDPPPPRGVCGGIWGTDGAVINEFSCITDTDPLTVEEYTDTDCYRLQEASNGHVFQTELPFLDACGAQNTACILYDMNNRRFDSINYVCGPNSSPQLGGMYKDEVNNYEGVINSIEYSYTDSSSYLINVTTGPIHWEGGASNSFFELETEDITKQGEVIADAGNGFQYVVRVPRLGEFLAYALAQDFGSFVDIDIGDIVTVEIHNNPKWKFRGKF